MCRPMCAQVPFHWHVLSCNPFRAAILSNTLPPVQSIAGSGERQAGHQITWFFPPPCLFTSTAVWVDRLTLSLWTHLWVALTLTCTRSYAQYYLFSILSDSSISLFLFPSGVVLIMHFLLCVWAELLWMCWVITTTPLSLRHRYLEGTKLMHGTAVKEIYLYHSQYHKPT